MVKEAKVVHITLKGSSTDIRLPKTIEVKNYAVGVVNVQGFLKIDWSQTQSVPLCSNVCESSFYNDSLKPILCSISRRPPPLINDEKATGSNHVENIHNVVWLKTSGDELSNVHVYLNLPQSVLISEGDCQLTCTLVFIPLR